jgi:hypothetical protein
VGKVPVDAQFSGRKRAWGLRPVRPFVKCLGRDEYEGARRELDVDIRCAGSEVKAVAGGFYSR